MTSYRVGDEGRLIDEEGYEAGYKRADSGEDVISLTPRRVDPARLVVPGTDLDATLEVIIRGRRGRVYGWQDMDSGDWSGALARMLAQEVPAAGGARIIFSGGTYNWFTQFLVNKEKITFELDERASLVKNWALFGAPGNEANALIRLEDNGSSSLASGFKLLGPGRLIGTFDYDTNGNITTLPTSVIGDSLSTEYLIRLHSGAAGGWIDDVEINGPRILNSAGKGIYADLTLTGARMSRVKIENVTVDACNVGIQLDTRGPSVAAGSGITLRDVEVSRTWNPTAGALRFGGDSAKGSNGITFNGAAWDDILLERVRTTDTVGRIGVEMFDNAPESNTRYNCRGVTLRNCVLEPARYRTLSLCYQQSLTVAQCTVVDKASYVEIWAAAPQLTANTLIGTGFNLLASATVASGLVEPVKRLGNGGKIEGNTIINPGRFHGAVHLTGVNCVKVSNNTVVYNDGGTNVTSNGVRIKELQGARRHGPGPGNENLNAVAAFTVLDSYGVVVDETNRVIYESNGTRLPNLAPINFQNNTECRFEKIQVEVGSTITNRWESFTATTTISADRDSGAVDNVYINPLDTFTAPSGAAGTVVEVTKRLNDGLTTIHVKLNSATHVANGEVVTFSSGATCTASSASSGQVAGPLIELGGNAYCSFDKIKGYFGSKADLASAYSVLSIRCVPSVLNRRTYVSASKTWNTTAIIGIYNAPPATTVNGGLYLVGDTGTGLFAGHNWQIATAGDTTGTSFTFANFIDIIPRNTVQRTLGFQSTSGTLTFVNPFNLPHPWANAGEDSENGHVVPTNGDVYIEAYGASIGNTFTDCDPDIGSRCAAWVRDSGGNVRNATAMSYYANSLMSLVWGDKWVGCREVPGRNWNSPATTIFARMEVQQATTVARRLPPASSITLDLHTTSHFVITLTGNQTLAAPLNKIRQQRFVLEFLEDASSGGAHTLTATGSWLTNIPADFNGGTAGQRRTLVCQVLADSDAAVVVSASTWA